MEMDENKKPSYRRDGEILEAIREIEYQLVKGGVRSLPPRLMIQFTTIRSGLLELLERRKIDED